MKTVVLIPGTFNPVTKAHINLGLLAKSTFPNADILYIPSKSSFLKTWKNFDNKNILDETTRFDLLKEAVSEYGFNVTKIEIEGTVSGKTYDTISWIKNNLGYEEIYLCMGTDKLPELHKWFKAKELVTENKFLIITRDGNSLNKAIKDSSLLIKENKENFIEIKNETYSNLSSTKIRELIELSDLEAIKDLVPDCVNNYYKSSFIENKQRF